MISKKQIYAIAALLLIVAIVGWFTPRFQPLDTGATGTVNVEDYIPVIMYQGLNTSKPVAFAGTFTLGLSGTAQTNQITTTCSPKLDGSITATSTGYGYCTGVTGVVSTDNVLAQFSTSTPVSWVVGSDAFVIVGAKASSTPGVIDFQIANWSGKNAAPSAVGRAGSTTVIHASH